MGKFGGFYKGETKKKKKKELDKKARENIERESFYLPQVEIIKKGKK